MRDISHKKREFAGSLSKLVEDKVIFLGKETLKASSNKLEDGRCQLKFTQVNDVDNNQLLLELSDVKGASGNRATFDIKFNGKRIPEFQRHLKCYVDPMYYNRICEVDYSGGVYENGNKVK